MEDHLLKILQRAITLFSLKRYDECIRECRKALAIDVSNTAPLELILNCMINTNKPAKEIQEIAKVLLNIEANNAAAHFAMGHYYGERFLYDKAIASFQSAINFDPNNADYLLRLAYAYEMNDEFQKVSETIARALAIDPNHEGGLTYKSQYESRHLLFKDASSSAKLALEQNPLSPMAHAQNGNLALANMNSTKAATHFMAAMQQDPSDLEYRRGYLNSLLAESFPFKYLFSKHWIFNNFPDLVRTLIILLFTFMILLFKTKTEEGGLVENIGYCLSWIGFCINFLQWFIAPVWRYFKSKRLWNAAPLPFRSESFYALLSIQLALIALFYYFITNDFRGASTAMFLAGYALVSLVPLAKENVITKKILFGILVLCYFMGFINLVLDIYMAPEPTPKAITMLPMTGWIIIVLLSEALDWLQLKMEGN